MKTLTKIGVVGGLLAALAGCANNDVSAVGNTINMTKPRDCEKVIDFSNTYMGYNLHCEEGGKSVFYFRSVRADKWTKVIFEDSKLYAENPQGGQ